MTATKEKGVCHDGVSIPGSEYLPGQGRGASASRRETYDTNTSRIRWNKTPEELAAFEAALKQPGAVVLDGHDKIELARWRAELEGRK